MSQPMPAPTRTPATSSVDSRKPRAIAEESAVGRGQLKGRRALGAESHARRATNEVVRDYETFSNGLSPEIDVNGRGSRDTFHEFAFETFALERVQPKDTFGGMTGTPSIVFAGRFSGEACGLGDLSLRVRTVGVGRRGRLIRAIALATGIGICPSGLAGWSRRRRSADGL